MSGIGAKHILNDNSPHYPLDPVVSTAHLTEHIELRPTIGAIAPDGTAEFDISLDADVLKKLTLELHLSAIANEVATQSAYVNWIGLACWDEITVRFGTEKLQTTIRSEEMYAKINKLMDDEERLMAQKMLGFDTLANRAAAAATAQYVYVPLYTLLGLHIGADPSQSIFVRGLGERLNLRIHFRPFNKWIEANGSLASPTSATTVLSDSYLLCEYEHVYDDERAKLEQIYSMPRRYVFDEYQYNSTVRIPGTQALSGSLDVELRNFNQPVSFWVVIFRWAADLDRVNLLADPGLVEATFGFRAFNVDDWYNAGDPLISHVTVKSGSSNFILKRSPVQRLVTYEHARVYKGSNDVGVISWSHSYDPSRPNAVLGFVDPSQMERPVLTLEFSGTAAAYATINAAATALLGANSDLDVTVLAATKNQLNFDNHQVRHPFN